MSLKRKEEEMRKSLWMLVGFGMVVLCMSTAHAQSGIPEKMVVKGVLPEQAEGLKLTATGKVSLTFAVYDAQGSLLWSEKKDDITLGANGAYSVILGEVSPLSPELFERGPECFLGTVVHLEERDIEILPRQPLLPTGIYAFKALYAERLIEGETVPASSPPSIAQVPSAGGKNTVYATTYVNSLTAGAGLSGNATTGNITLKVKNLGITKAMLANASVAAAKIAQGAVTADKLAAGAVGASHLAPASITAEKISTTGGTSGQVLTVSASGAAWQTLTGGAFQLPYAGSVDSMIPAFSVSNTNTGYVWNDYVYGGAFYAPGPSGIGVYGSAPNAGMLGVSTGDGSGIWGKTDSSLSTQAGVRGESFEGGAPGVRAFSKLGDGVATYSYGTYKSGVYGVGSGTSGFGGYFVATASDGTGLYGLGPKYGVYGESQDNYGVGLVGAASGSMVSGIMASVSNTANDSYGVYASATGPRSVGLYAEGASDGYGAVFKGNVQILGASSGATVMELGEGLDYAEGFRVTDKERAAPGTVLVIDPQHPGQLAMSMKPYDTKVAGIVAGARGLGSGVRLGAGQFDHDVALAGRVYCNVDGTYGEVAPGDLLTTSMTEGHAMVVKDHSRAQGAILGKAMESLEKGKKGQILVLVTLQ
jgi:hypothetical protein